MEVVERAIDLLEIDGAVDTVVDIGAGDGRFMVRCAERTGANILGVEIDEERGAEAEAKIEAAGVCDKCKLIIGNALDQDYAATGGTAFFLYLIPRGLRIVLPILQAIARPLRVVTYISPFPDEVQPVQVIKVKSAKHADSGVEWPLYVYELNGVAVVDKDSTDDGEIGDGAAPNSDTPDTVFQLAATVSVAATNADME